jgi:hypothetical protein
MITICILAKGGHKTHWRLCPESGMHTMQCAAHACTASERRPGVIRPVISRATHQRVNVGSVTARLQGGREARRPAEWTDNVPAENRSPAFFA